MAKSSPISATFQLSDDLTYSLGANITANNIYDASSPLGSYFHFRTIDIGSYELPLESNAIHPSHIPGGPYLVGNGQGSITNLTVQVGSPTDEIQTTNFTPTRLTLSYAVVDNSFSVFNPNNNPNSNVKFVREWQEGDLKIAIPNGNEDREYYVVGLQISLDQSHVEDPVNPITIDGTSPTGDNRLKFNEWDSKIFDNGASFTLYLQDAASGSNQVYMVDANASLIEIYSTVPEPSTLLLLCTATLPAYLLRKRLVRARRLS